MTRVQVSISQTRLQAAFTCKDLKSAKRQPSHQCLFALLESACIKAACKHVDEVETRSQYRYPDPSVSCKWVLTLPFPWNNNTSFLTKVNFITEEQML